MLAGVNGVSVGLRVRALRRHKRLRQEDVARLARVSRGLVSKVERGLLDNVQIGEVDRIVSALGGSFDLRVRWHGEQLERLLDDAHARIVDFVVALLRAAGWEVLVEASFSQWGERGSIDVLAYHRATRILLVIEVKSVVPDNQAMLYDLDRKTRLAQDVAQAGAGMSGRCRDSWCWATQLRHGGGSSGSLPRLTPRSRFGAGRSGAGSGSRPAASRG